MSDRQKGMDSGTDSGMGSGMDSGTDRLDAFDAEFQQAIADLRTGRISERAYEQRFQRLIEELLEIDAQLKRKLVPLASRASAAGKPTLAVARAKRRLPYRRRTGQQKGEK